MQARTLPSRGIAVVVSVCLLFAGTGRLSAEAQFGKRLLQIGACGGGALLGAQAGEAIVNRIVQLESVRKNLSAVETEALTKSFKIGFALAVCGGGAALTGTTYNKLSKRGKESRERELLAAVEDAQPRTYADPDRPTLHGTLTPQPSIVEGDKECRMIEDYLADGDLGDKAMVKYCRPSSGGAWKLDAI